MNRRLRDGLIGFGLGVLFTFAFQAHAERVTEPAVVHTTPTVDLVLKAPRTPKTEHPLTTEEAVREYFKDIPILIEVARCESQFRQYDNGHVLHGRVDHDDTGVMQINTRFHLKKAIALGYDLNDLYGNMAYARSLYRESGLAPWEASRGCWGKAR